MRTCANCGQQFKRRIMGINLGLKRKEKCPHCGRWNTFDIHGNNVAILNEEPEEPSGLEAAEDLSEEERLERKLEESRYE
jgi:predicted  nucleic acid-binding Zn-ribbon protein